MSPLWSCLGIAAGLALSTANVGAEAAPRAKPKSTGMVVLGISGLGSQKGHVRCALFESEGWLDKAFRTAVAKVHGSTAVCRFKDVPAGRYAVAAFHDLDDDGELDKVLGIPSEPYCFSRDARGSFGPPSFDAASFRHSGPKTVERARMK